MDLRLVDRPVSETNRRDALSLSPLPFAIPSAQPPKLSDRPAGGNYLDAPHRADNLEVHRPKLAHPSCSPDSSSFAEERAGTLRAPKATVSLIGGLGVNLRAGGASGHALRG